ncbi:unnamed protein product [Cylindrotheca closterium]|uniref:VTT domain-containing protein n=1 Tax=Cylindrotheca closterium TaxID=2856 RepID=A0AAD2G8S3_9STRA|nr:unnamed protein product [Cylindrotheca closterium]
MTPETTQDDTEAPAMKEGDYYLDEDSDDNDSQTQKTAYCCTGQGKPITTAELWEEFKDLSSELWDYVRYRCWKKKLLTAVLVICAIGVCCDLAFGGLFLNWLALFVAWMAYHPVEGVFAYVAVFVVATLLFVPEIFLVFAAGFAFSAAIGTWEGMAVATLASFLASGISAIIAFIRARYMMRDLIQLFAKRYPLVMCADRALERNGFRVLVLLRLCPVIPYNALNYCAGVTDISAEHFLQSLVGVIPFQMFLATVGATTARYSAIDLHNNQEQRLILFALLGAGICFGAFGVLLIWRLVKQELQKELELSDKQMKGYITMNPDDFVEQGVEVSAKRFNVKEGDEDESDQFFWVWA